MKKKSKKKRSIILILAVLVFTVYAAGVLIHNQFEIAEQNRQKAAIESQVADEKVKNEELKDQLRSDGDKEYIARMAREKLGYVYPDERVYVDDAGS